MSDPSNTTILLVEDDAHLQRLLKRVLEGAGFTVIAANDGVEAMEYLAEHSVGLVITDGQMPRMTGAQLMTHLRTTRPTQRMLGLSGGDRKATLETGNIPTLSKPFELQEFLTVVRDLLAEPPGTA